MSYKMNIGNEVAQAKRCYFIDDFEQFCKDHNLELDSLSFDENRKFSLFAKYTEDDDVKVVVAIESRGYRG